MIREKDEIDLAFDPPPDLGIEVDVTRSSLNRLGIYAALGIPEVWRFDGNELEVYQLDSGGGYRTVEHSQYFASIPLGEISKFLLQRTSEDENQLTRSFREWVRQQVG